jgi:hypothetical protein
MNLYEIAEDAYLARAGNVSTNGIGAAVDAVLEALRKAVEELPVYLVDERLDPTTIPAFRRTVSLGDVLLMIGEVTHR